MAISHFWGIRELGILTSTGIVLCAVILFALVAGLMHSGNSLTAQFDLSFLNRILVNTEQKSLSFFCSVYLCHFLFGQ